MNKSKMANSTLADLCCLVTDGTHDTPKVVERGIPFIKAKEIVGGIIDFENCEHISYEDHLDVIARSKPEMGDILFAHIGASLGEAAFIKTDKEFSIKNIALFKPNSVKINNRYLYYLVLSHKFQTEIKNSRTGAAQPFVSLDILRNHKIYYHSNLETQDKIAFILSAYDDLIENNNRRIKILEEMAQTIYNEWFVKFRFPGHNKVKIVKSELGEIPEGWVVKQLDDIIDIQSGFAFKSGTFTDDGKYGLVTIKNVQDGKFVTECDSRLQDIPKKVPEYCLLKNGDILLSLTGNVGRVCLCYGNDYLLNQRVAKLVPKVKTDRAYIYFMYSQPHFRTKLEMISTGVAQQNLSPVEMGRIKIVYPAEAIRKSYTNVCNPILDEILVLFQKNAIFQQTRDLLLPRLISGELDVENLDIKVDN